MQDEHLKILYIRKKRDLEKNRSKTIDIIQENIICRKLNKFDLPKKNKIISIIFPLISRLPQQADFKSNYDSVKISQNSIRQNKIRSSRKELFSKFLVKKQKLSIKKRYITIPDTKENSNINTNINFESNRQENIFKKGKSKSNFGSVSSNEVHCITIGNQSFEYSKLNSKESYLITNIPTYSQNKITEDNNCYRNNIKNINNINIFRMKKMQSAKSNKSFNKNYLNNKKDKHTPENFLSNENYLNSEFIKEVISKKKPYLEPISLDQFTNRLLQIPKKRKENLSNSLSILPDYLKNPGFKIEYLKKDKVKEKSKESLKNSKESKSREIKNLDIINGKLTRDEILNIFKKKKLRKCDLLIGKTSEKLNKIKSEIASDYTSLINSFNNYDDL